MFPSLPKKKTSSNISNNSEKSKNYGPDHYPVILPSNSLEKPKQSPTKTSKESKTKIVIFFLNPKNKHKMQ